MAVVISDAHVNPLGLPCVPPIAADQADEEAGRDQRSAEDPPGTEASQQAQPPELVTM
jgi:hypothetical protein